MRQTKGKSEMKEETELQVEASAAHGLSSTEGAVHERVVIPCEVLDLVRFMCETWAMIDEWAYTTGDAIMHYPVVQGTKNQFNLKRIGQQQYNKESIQKAVRWMLESKV